MATVPRGILEVKWKNSTSKEKQIKYRVRISRKNLKADEYFDTLEEAKDTWLARKVTQVLQK
jgi:hypothetical protein